MHKSGTTFFLLGRFDLKRSLLPRGISLLLEVLLDVVYIVTVMEGVLAEWVHFQVLQHVVLH
jgi:hypothetical protein